MVDSQRVLTTKPLEDVLQGRFYKVKDLDLIEAVAKKVQVRLAGQSGIT